MTNAGHSLWGECYVRMMILALGEWQCQSPLFRVLFQWEVVVGRRDIKPEKYHYAKG